jgi:putative spermidine/putrescine transport system substrate-binding protein
MNLRRPVRALITGAFACGAAGAVSAQELTVASWGGQYTYSQVEAYQKPFAEKTGIDIISEDYTGNVAPIRAQV